MSPRDRRSLRIYASLRAIAPSHHLRRPPRHCLPPRPQQHRQPHSHLRNPHRTAPMSLTSTVRSPSPHPTPALNQILRDIARLTGIKITGGVVDERVFGNYGPDAPNNVLDALLDGTEATAVSPRPQAASLPNSSSLRAREAPPHPTPTPPDSTTAATRGNRRGNCPTPPSSTSRNPIPRPPTRHRNPQHRHLLTTMATTITEPLRPQTPASSSLPAESRRPSRSSKSLQRLRQQQQQQQQKDSVNVKKGPGNLSRAFHSFVHRILPACRSANSVFHWAD